MRTEKITIRERLTRRELAEFICNRAEDFIGEAMMELCRDDRNEVEMLEMEFYTPCGGVIYVNLNSCGGGEVYVVSTNREDHPRLQEMIARELPAENVWRNAKDEAEEEWDEPDDDNGVNYFLHREMPAYYGMPIL